MTTSDYVFPKGTLPITGAYACPLEDPVSAYLRDGGGAVRGPWDEWAISGLDGAR